MSQRPSLASRPSSPTLSTYEFAPSRALPATPRSSKADQLPPTNLGQKDSICDFDILPQAHDAFDLVPPPPRVSHTNAELMAERLFSADHLDIILKGSSLSARFTNFLNNYRPQSVPTLVRHLESQKALAAIRYANSLADQMSASPRRSSKRDVAVVDTEFDSISRKAVEELVSEALPAYVTYRMVNVVTEVLVKEITGNNTPLMREMVKGLAEVYCITDPSLPDNPIVFASEEFHNTTQYGQEYVIGKNCRFLQGPRTQQQAVGRISSALDRGEEISEILLNYRRDGSPFLNLVMMAPLMDHCGAVRYFIGCQIDISHLIEGGRGLESFKRLLDQADLDKTNKPSPDPLRNKPSLGVLRELGGLLSEEEIEIVRDPARANSHRRERSIESNHSGASRIPHPPRRFVGTEEPEMHPWPPAQFDSSGRLPGVYQNYLLVRPYPSLRIIFTSPSLRIPGLSQSHLMDRVGGPQHVREGVLEALSQGIGVTAKISWLTQSSPSCANTHAHSNSTSTTDSTSPAPALKGKPRWIHCTPLLGSDSRPGVWMVVMVDKEEITGCLNSIWSSKSQVGLRGGGDIAGAGAAVASARLTSAKIFSQYMRREGIESRGGTFDEDARC